LSWNNIIKGVGRKRGKSPLPKKPCGEQNYLSPHNGGKKSNLSRGFKKGRKGIQSIQPRIGGIREKFFEFRTIDPQKGRSNSWAPISKRGKYIMKEA